MPYEKILEIFFVNQSLKHVKIQNITNFYRYGKFGYYKKICFEFFIVCPRAIHYPLLEPM